MFKYCKPLMACFQKKSCERFCGGLFVADPNNCSSTLFDDWADVNEYWTISVEPGSNCVGGEGLSNSIHDGVEPCADDYCLFW